MLNLRLRPLNEADEDEAAAAHKELADDRFDFLLGWDPEMGWDTYLAALVDRRQGVALSAGWVPETFLIAAADDVLVGRVSIRHCLNDYLENFGGHIGYAVRPQHRGRGAATEILRQALVVARALGINDVLMTVDDTNTPSIRVIERNGGVYDGVRVDNNGTSKRRYWIR